MERLFSLVMLLAIWTSSFAGEISKDVQVSSGACKVEGDSKDDIITGDPCINDGRWVVLEICSSGVLCKAPFKKVHFPPGATCGGESPSKTHFTNREKVVSELLTKITTGVTPVYPVKLPNGRYEAKFPVTQQGSHNRLNEHYISSIPLCAGK